MRINIIAAVSINGIIGHDGRLPWKLKADMEFFKKMTSNKIVIMGRKTFESIGRALPNRVNIVITSDPACGQNCGILNASDFTSALELAAICIEQNKDEEGVDYEDVFIIGGSSVYEQALDVADRMYITQVHEIVEGTVRFPSIDTHKWNKDTLLNSKKCNDNEYDFSIVQMDKIKAPSYIYSRSCCN